MTIYLYELKQVKVHTHTHTHTRAHTHTHTHTHTHAHTHKCQCLSAKVLQEGRNLTQHHCGISLRRQPSSTRRHAHTARTYLVERDEALLTDVEQRGDGGITVQGESTMSGQFNWGRSNQVGGLRTTRARHNKLHSIRTDLERQTASVRELAPGA